MKSPVGMEEIDPGSSSEDCFQLLKGIYGLCQATTLSTQQKKNPLDFK